MDCFQELEGLVKDDIIQMKEEGYDITKFEKSFGILNGKMKNVPELIDLLNDLEKKHIKIRF